MVDTTLLNPKYRKWIMRFVAVVFLVGIFVAYVPYFISSKRMHKFCDGLAVGTSVEAIKSQAEVNDYEVVPLEAGHLLVHDPDSVGRRNCDVKIGPQGMTSAAYFSGDSVFSPPQTVR